MREDVVAGRKMQQVLHLIEGASGNLEDADEIGGCAGAASLGDVRRDREASP